MSDNVVIAHLTAPERFRTQTRLAEAAGVKPHTICGKTDESPLTYKQMRSILVNAPALGVVITPADFFPDLIGDEAGRAA